MKKILYLLFMLAVLFASCGEEGPLGKDEPKKPGVTTQAATDVQMFTATLNAKLVLPEQMATDFEIGFEISEDQIFPEETTQKLKSKSYDPNFKYSCNIETLDPGTTYYVRAYMINQMGLYLGDTKTFSTTALEIITFDIDTTNYSVTTHVNVQQLSTKRITYGVCYGTTDSLTVDGQKVTANEVDKDNNYKVTLTNVPFGTTVYYCSYVTINGVTTYGDIKSFGGNEVTTGTIDETDYTVTVGEYVDLGLSVKWATCNVGATKPEEYGDYFAWGATEPLYVAGYAQENPQQHWKAGKSDGYTWVNTPYQTANTTDYSSTKWTKYLGSTSSENKDPSATDANALKTVLAPEDDAAHVNRGGSWRMPTKAEQDELHNNCTWTWTTLNGVNGYKVQSMKPGYTDKWIFLPASGYRYDSRLYDVGYDGRYWSSSLLTGSPYRAYSLYFSSSAVARSNGRRCYGQSVRPVCP